MTCFFIKTYFNNSMKLRPDFLAKKKVSGFYNYIKFKLTTLGIPKSFNS